MPRGSQLRVVDPVLTNLLRGYTNAEFQGLTLFPYVSVKKESGKIPSFGKEAWRLYNTERALRAASNKLPVEARNTIDFVTTEHDAAYPIDYREPQEDIINTQAFAAYMAQSAIQIKHEKACADIARNLSNYASSNKITLSGTSQFTHASSTPITVVDNAIEAIRAKTGKRPNTGLLGPTVFKALKNHSTIVERIKYSQRGVVTVELLQEILGIKKLVVADALYVSDDLATTYDMWGDDFIVAYVPEEKSDVQRSVYEPSYGYTLRKEGMPEGDTYVEEGGKIENVRSTDNFIVKLTGADAGYLINDCCA